MGAFQLIKISGSAVNGTRFVGSSHWKIPRKSFYQSEIPLLLPPKFPDFFPKWKAPKIIHVINHIRKEKTENKYLLNYVPQIFLHSQNIDAITGTRRGWQWPLILPLFGFP